MKGMFGCLINFLPGEELSYPSARVLHCSLVKRTLNHANNKRREVSFYLFIFFFFFISFVIVGKILPSFCCNTLFLCRKQFVGTIKKNVLIITVVVVL